MPPAAWQRGRFLLPTPGRNVCRVAIRIQLLGHPLIEVDGKRRRLAGRKRAESLRAARCSTTSGAAKGPAATVEQNIN